MDFDLMALIQALRGRSGAKLQEPTQDPAEKARASAEQISQILPEAIMPRKALEEDRRRKALIDALRGE